MSVKLGNIRLVHSTLTDNIYMIRHGKDERVALDKRDAEADVYAVLVDHMMHNAPKGAVRHIKLGDNEYEITVKPKVQP